MEAFVDEQEKLRKDAERYRWIRDIASNEEAAHLIYKAYTSDHLDRLIDYKTNIPTLLKKTKS